MRETNEWGRQYRVAKITGCLNLSLLLQPVEIIAVVLIPPPFPILRVAPVAEKAMWWSQCGVQPQTSSRRARWQCRWRRAGYCCVGTLPHLPFSHSKLLSEGPWPNEVRKDQLMTRIIFVTNRKDSFPYFVYSNKHQQNFL